MKTALGLALCALVSLGGCHAGGGHPDAGGSSPSATPTASATPSGSASPSPSPPPSATPSAEPGCPNQATVLSTPAAMRPGSLRGDVDGDGSKDTVRIAVDLAGPPGCQAILVVRSRGASVAAPIAQFEPSPVLPAPHLNLLARIDADPGAEVVVDVAAGASTQFEGVYADVGGEISPVVLKGFRFDGLYAYGGSVGHLDGEACTRRGTIVISGATAKGFSGVRYKVVRRFFRPGDGALVYRPRLTQRRLLRPGALQLLREFSGGPFAGCSVP